MSDKVLGLTELKVEEFVQKYGCIINRTDLVPVVSVEWLENVIKIRKKIIDTNINDEISGTVEEMRKLNKMKESALWELNNLLEAVRLEALK